MLLMSPLRWLFGHSQGAYATPQGNVGLGGGEKPVLWLESKQGISAQEFPFLPRLTNASCFLWLLLFVCLCVRACTHTCVLIVTILLGVQ